MVAAESIAPAPLNPRMGRLPDVLPAGGCELEVSILVADVRGSTALAERLTPTAFSELMRRFYGVATEVVVGFGGVVEKLVGDGVVALFIPGLAGADHARAAIDAARALLSALGHDADGSPCPAVGVAVHTGRVWLGVVAGPYGRRDVTALGHPVNLAAHLCADAAAGQLVVSEQARRAAGHGDSTAPAPPARSAPRPAPVAARRSEPARREPAQSPFRVPGATSKSFRYSPYPSASSFSTGMNRSAAELMQ